MVACLIQTGVARFNRDPYDLKGTDKSPHDTYGAQKTFTNRIDHFDDSNTNTYQQRYWVNDTFHEAGGPVFMYICGEWACRATNPEINPAL